MASAEVLLPSPRVNMLDSGQLTSVDSVSLCGGPHRGVRRPSATAESESDSPPSKRSKQARRRKKKRQLRLARPGGGGGGGSGAFGMRAKPVAPLNTTQFLMAEHDQLQDTDIVVSRPRRHRDSSLSVDSEDQQYDEFYSSPEDEEEFLAREFWTAYEDVHAERLDTMTKAQLVQEYLALEEKVDLLERQLRAVRARHRHRQRQEDNTIEEEEEEKKKEEEEEEEEEGVRPGEVLVDSETAEKISIFQSEISSLETENRRLREENSKLRRSSRSSSSSSSSSEDSSSSSSSSSSESSDSESDMETEEEERRPALAAHPTTTCSSELLLQTPDTSAESRLDSGVSCDGAEALPEADREEEEVEKEVAAQPSSLTTPPASPTLEEEEEEAQAALKDEVSGSSKGGSRLLQLEAEVSSTTST